MISITMIEIIEESAVFFAFLFLTLVMPVDMITGTLPSLRVNESLTSNECGNRPW